MNGYYTLDPCILVRVVIPALRPPLIKGLQIFAMRHALDDMIARQECMNIMREIFRQLVTFVCCICPSRRKPLFPFGGKMLRVQISQNNIYLDSRISFNEIPQYFMSGCACAYFQVAVDVYTDLRYNKEEWEE